MFVFYFQCENFVNYNQGNDEMITVIMNNPSLTLRLSMTMSREAQFQDLFDAFYGLSVSFLKFKNCLSNFQSIPFYVVSILCVPSCESVVVDHFSKIIKISKFVLWEKIFCKYLISFLIFKNYLVPARKAQINLFCLWPKVKSRRYSKSYRNE